MSKIEVDAITQQSGTTLTVGGGACKTATVDATTVTLGRSGGTVSLAAGATQSGFGRTGTVDWDTTPKTATFSAVSGDGFFANTTGSAFNMNLPAGSAGAIVSVADYAGTWQTNALTVVPNGTDKIGGVNANVVLNTEGQSITFVYVDSTQGWINTMDSTSNERASSFITATGGTITTVCTNFKVHTFTSPGTFCVSAGGGSKAVVDYLVVAGGGGGRNGPAGGGGGAGGFRESKCSTTSGCWTASPLASSTSLPVSVQGYPITVGAGGANGATTASQGSNSILSSITSAGGGGGGGTANTPSENTNMVGGSGGGASNHKGACSGAAGNTPPVSPPQGNRGGNGSNPGVTGNYPSGGGGGATAQGGDGPNSGSGASGPGGAGATSSINGTPTTRAGGGGAGHYTGEGSPGFGTGGSGGGAPGQNGASGTVNTGGGGGSNDENAPTAGGAGGSGIVIIRYKFQ